MKYLADKHVVFVAKKHLRKAVVDKLNLAVVSCRNKSTHGDVDSHRTTIGLHQSACNSTIANTRLLNAQSINVRHATEMLCFHFHLK